MHLPARVTLINISINDRTRGVSSLHRSFTKNHQMVIQFTSTHLLQVVSLKSYLALQCSVEGFSRKQKSWVRDREWITDGKVSGVQVTSSNIGLSAEFKFTMVKFNKSDEISRDCAQNMRSPRKIIRTPSSAQQIIKNWLTFCGYMRCAAILMNLGLGER